jgi:hypothetical protein
MDMRCFRINTPLVATETIDGEAILIHFESGCYYSTNKLGADILGMIDGHNPVITVSRSLAERHGQRSAEAVGALVSEFLATLEREELIVLCHGSSSDEIVNPTVASGQALDPPVLQKFSDLQDLLVLDPIHDVDRMGWPVPAPAGQGRKLPAEGR